MHCIVTAGPTHEPLDKVRRLTNFSTGTLGSQLAAFLQEQGHEVTLLIGETATYRGELHARSIKTFTTTANLRELLQSISEQRVGALFHAAAVSDFAFGKLWHRGEGGELSEVQAGKVARTKVPCDAGKMVLTSAQTSQFGGRIFRSASPANGSTQDPSPRLTLYGRSPIVELKAPGPLLIERIDQAGERHMIEVRAEHLLHGKFYDFAKSGRNLAAGGVYRISGGGQEIVFKIDSTAKPGGTPIMGRLLRLGTQS